jgi:hypothetical protein
LNRGIANENLNNLTAACNDWSEASKRGLEAAQTFLDKDCK